MFYKLIDTKPVRCTIEEYVAWRWDKAENKDWIVAKTIVGESEVSTVFLGIDHSCLSLTAVPVLFETMVFGGPDADFQTRHRTYAEALYCHDALVRALRLLGSVEEALVEEERSVDVENR